jgi:outer membrane lipoprotein SlyB
VKQRWFAVALAVSAIAATTACATNDGPRDYRTSEERTVQNVSYGTVQSVRTVHVDKDSAPVGTIAGAAVGGILGSQVGHGAGSGVAAVLGAVGGGLAGNAIEHKVSEHEALEVTVRLDNGSTVAVVQEGQAELRPGDRVQVLSGSGSARVERI